MLSRVSGLIRCREFCREFRTNCLRCWFSHSRNKAVQESVHLSCFVKLHPGLCFMRKQDYKNNGGGRESCRGITIGIPAPPDSNSEIFRLEKKICHLFWYHLPNSNDKHFSNSAPSTPTNTAHHPILGRKEILDNILKCCLRGADYFISTVINRVTNHPYLPGTEGNFQC